MPLTVGQLATLKSELLNNPLALPYVTGADEANAVILNDTTRRTIARPSIDAGTVVASIVMSEFATLTADQKSFLQMLCAAQTVQLTSTLKTQLGLIFPNATTPTTRANIIALQSQPGSRAAELGLPSLTTSDVAQARLS
jgi:hypothetical protein